MAHLQASISTGLKASRDAPQVPSMLTRGHKPNAACCGVGGVVEATAPPTRVLCIVLWSWVRKAAAGPCPGDKPHVVLGHPRVNPHFPLILPGICTPGLPDAHSCLVLDRPEDVTFIKTSPNWTNVRARWLIFCLAAEWGVIV
jgi:hypothetical protein